MTISVRRRRFLAAAGGLVAGAGLPAAAVAQGVRGDVQAMQEAIRKVVGGARVSEGRVKIDLPPLSENGQAVPLTVSVESPMTASDHVRTIHVFNEKNPQPDVAAFHLGPRAGRATVATRVRLADTQTVIALARMSDGSWWSGSTHVIVTLAACLEEL